MKLLPSVFSNAVLVFEHAKEFGARSPYFHRGLAGIAVVGFGLLSLQVAQASAPLNVSVTSSVASGGDADFTFTSSSDLGAGSISWIQGIFNNSPDGRDACYFIYTAGDHRVYLSKDGASGDWIDSGVMGESRSISNSQCSIDLTRATFTTGSTTLTIKLPIHFYFIFNGAKPIWMLTGDINNAIDAAAWQNMASYTAYPATAPPINVTLSPNTGTGYTQKFSYSMSSPLGPKNILSGLMVINSVLDGNSGCYLGFYRSSRQFNLYAQPQSGFVGAQGTAGAGQPVIESNYCQLDLSQSSIDDSDTRLIVTVALTFKTAMNGPRIHYLYASDRAAQVAGWNPMGNWQVGPAPPLGPLANVSVTANTTSGPRAKFAITASGPTGPSSLSWIQGIFNQQADGRDACYYFYSFLDSYVYLSKDAVSGDWIDSGRLGDSKVLSNTQCRINLATSTVAIVGTNVALSLDVTFQSVFAGAQPMWMLSGDVNGHYDAAAWQQMISYTAYPAPTAPVLVSVTPNTGSSLNQVFEYQATSALGAGGLRWGYVLINGAVDGNSGCYVGWYRSSKVLTLNGQPGFAGASGVPGVGQPVIESNYCKLDLAQSAVDTVGANLSIKLAITFKPAMVGSKNNYLYAVDRAGQATGFTSLGSWGMAAANTISLSPTVGPVGTSVTISGANFGSSQGASTVTFNGNQASIVSWSASSIVAKVEPGASTGNVVVTVGGVASPPQLFNVTPLVTSFSPTSGGANTAVTIGGLNFGSSGTVKFGTIVAQTFVWSGNVITAAVPAGASGNVEVSVTVGGYTAKASQLFYVTGSSAPFISSISPLYGAAGTVVTIQGSNLGSTGSITFNGAAATATFWSSTTIVVPVPLRASTGPVLITVAGVQTGGQNFTVSDSTLPLPSPSPPNPPSNLLSTLRSYPSVPKPASNAPSFSPQTNVVISCADSTCTSTNSNPSLPAAIVRNRVAIFSVSSVNIPAGVTVGLQGFDYVVFKALTTISVAGTIQSYGPRIAFDSTGDQNIPGVITMKGQPGINGVVGSIPSYNFQSQQWYGLSGAGGKGGDGGAYASPDGTAGDIRAGPGGGGGGGAGYPNSTNGMYGEGTIGDGQPIFAPFTTTVDCPSLVASGAAGGSNGTKGAGGTTGSWFSGTYAVRNAQGAAYFGVNPQPAGGGSGASGGCASRQPYKDVDGSDVIDLATGGGGGGGGGGTYIFSTTGTLTASGTIDVSGGNGGNGGNGSRGYNSTVNGATQYAFGSGGGGGAGGAGGTIILRATNVNITGPNKLIANGGNGGTAGAAAGGSAPNGAVGPGGGGGRIAITTPNPIQGVTPTSTQMNAQNNAGGTPSIGVSSTPACTPTITGIKINGQVSNTVIAGTSGIIEINGSCLGGTLDLVRTTKKAA